jgi:hypothetical protein
LNFPQETNSKHEKTSANVKEERKNHLRLTHKTEIEKDKKISRIDNLSCLNLIKEKNVQ